MEAASGNSDGVAQSSYCYETGTAHVSAVFTWNSRVLTLHTAVVNFLTDGLWRLAIHQTSYAKGCSENLLDSTLQVLGHGLEAHGPCDIDYLIERNRLGVFDVLFLLPISRWLLESFDHE